MTKDAVLIVEIVCSHNQGQACVISFENRASVVGGICSRRGNSNIEGRCLCLPCHISA